MAAKIERTETGITFNGMRITEAQLEILDRWGNLPKYPAWGIKGDMDLTFSKEEQAFLATVPRDPDGPSDLSRPSVTHSPMINGRAVYPMSTIWNSKEKESYKAYKCGLTTKSDYTRGPNGILLTETQNNAIEKLVNKIDDIIERVEYMKLFDMSIDEDLLEEYYFEKHSRKLSEKKVAVKVVKKTN